MIQINLLPTEPGNVNLETLKKESKGTIAVILDTNGKFQGVNQAGEVVPVTVQAAPSVTSSLSAGEAENLIKNQVDALNNTVNKALKDASEAFTSQLRQIQDAHKKARADDSKAFHDHIKELAGEIKKLKPKAAPKSKAKANTKK